MGRDLILPSVCVAEADRPHSLTQCWETEAQVMRGQRHGENETTSSKARVGSSFLNNDIACTIKRSFAHRALGK